MKSRTYGVTLLALLVLFSAVAGLFRLIQTIQKWEFLKELIPIWPGYLAVSGLVWFIVGAALFWGLWTVRQGVGKFLIIAVGLYSVNFWLERTLLSITTGGSSQNNNWPFIAIINLFVIAWSIWETFRSVIIRRNEERYEQRSEDRKIT